MAFTFNLPFCLLLPDGDYQVKIAEGDIVTLQLTKKIPNSYDERLGMRGLTSADLVGYEHAGALNIDNDFKGKRARRFSVDEVMKTDEGLLIEFFEKSGKNFLPPMQLVMNQELPHDSFGRFRYSKVTFVSDNNDNLIERALFAINKLIGSYRDHTGHFWVTKIKDKDLQVFEKAGKPAAHRPLIKFRSDIDEDKIASIRKALLGDPIEIPAHTLYLDARSAYDQVNYTVSLIYSITAIESLVKTFLRLYSAKHKIKGVSRKTLLQSSIHYSVTVILRLLFSKTEFSDEIIAEFVRVNKIRNQVIHQAFLSVLEKDAHIAIHAVETFANILNPKIVDLFTEQLAEYHASRHKE